MRTAAGADSGPTLPPIQVGPVYGRKTMTCLLTSSGLKSARQELEDVVSLLTLNNSYHRTLNVPFPHLSIIRGDGEGYWP